MIFLYGPPGVGKSTIGKQLAQALNQPFWDVDGEIEKRAGATIPEIFAAQGETGFRVLEANTIGHLLNEEKGVVALGGGALLNEALCQQVTAAGQVICLQAPLAHLQSRLQQTEAERPLVAANIESKLPQLLAERHTHYHAFPLQVEATAAPNAIVWEIQMRLGAFHVRGMGAGYDVRVEDRGLSQLGSRLRARGLNGPLALVSDNQIAAHYQQPVTAVLQEAGYTVQPVLMHPGESHKTMETVGHFWEAFLSAGLERSSTVVALGGGVVGDLAGFAASSFLRGVPWVVLPTTLLAMVDASLGGKTGADLPQGKNLVGAFHPPRLVLADPAVLATLSDAELRSGLGEVVKHGIISDPALFALCGRGWDAVTANWTELVRRAMAVKIAIIQEDPFEGGRRAALNLGHTIGHAVEMASGFKIRHGEAIAIGTVVEASLAEKIGLAEGGLADEIAVVLQGLGLPTEIPAKIDTETIRRIAAVDKKRKGGQVRFALPAGIGDVRTGVQVPDWHKLI